MKESYVRIVQQSHPELDWVARRRAGETARTIADRAGVPEEMGLVATERLSGPFDPPARQGTYSVLSVTLLQGRNRRWVEDRRRGVRVKDIAERDGVTHQSVTRATRAWGPFPAQECVDAWVEARSRGRTIRSIADEFAILPSVVQRLTSSRGPFPRPFTGIPEGLETLQSIAVRAGVTHRALRHWQHLLPPADWVTHRGRQVWLSATIDRWFEGPTLDYCDLCGARPVSLAIHRGQRHAEADPSTSLDGL
ncbi:hypothetical protein KMZ32_16315 [Phycicoccus sp. MAQZ13P-2]|uniref:hypothetical protein n=1 Tax=Phycicoccus mangrovi TaxID=2840470 RepID=UPI001C0063DD|nr:hypothetical protein [Phycicoccus mangrovi]MBT9257482.1 hypothetical protein [Phycicoccus mangrovi]MBT9275644.1 hypothetical protein [Phycicoccus mangrovi]